MNLTNFGKQNKNKTLNKTKIKLEIFQRYDSNNLTNLGKLNQTKILN